MLYWYNMAYWWCIMPLRSPWSPSHRCHWLGSTGLQLQLTHKSLWMYVILCHLVCQAFVQSTHFLFAQKLWPIFNDSTDTLNPGKLWVSLGMEKALWRGSSSMVSSLDGRLGDCFILQNGNFQWIGWDNLSQKPWFFPWNIRVSCKFSLKLYIYIYIYNPLKFWNSYPFHW